MGESLYAEAVESNSVSNKAMLYSQCPCTNNFFNTSATSDWTLLLWSLSSALQKMSWLDSLCMADLLWREREKKKGHNE